MSVNTYINNEPLLVSDVATGSHSKYLSQKRFGSLDGLRAISILAVIWHHTAASGMRAPWGQIGAEGVTLFFAISGFLITTLLLRERDRNGKIDLKAFYLRRTLRIFPLYYGVLLIYIVVVTVMERSSAVGQGFFNNLLYFSTYTSNIFVPLDGRVIFYFAWSLAAEEQFYLIWPVVLYLTVTLPRAILPLCVVFATGVAGQILGIKLLSEVPLSIVVSSLLAIALHSEKGFRILQPVLGRSFSAVVLGIGLVVALTMGGVPNFIVGMLFAMFVGSCVIRENHVFSPLLLLKPVSYIGAISYGMYMLHMLSKNSVVKILSAFHFSGSGIQVFFLTVGMATIAANLSYRYYESFFLKLKTAHES